MMNNKQYLLALLTGIVLSFPVYSQICEPTLTIQNISAENFTVDNINGTVVDTITKLKWARCAHGQKWNGKTCDQFPIKLNWKDALTVADELDFGNETAWRVPDIKELMSIIDFQCFIPPLNTTIFPQAPTSLSNGLWSSTPVQTNPTSVTNSEGVKIWFIGMGEGKVQQRPWDQTNFVFFVSDGNVEVVR